MAATELDSFIWKFNQLWKAGITAHLDLDTHAGSAWVGLRVQLGHVAPGPLHQQVYQHQSFHKAGPSRQRRRARRLAAREKMSTAAAAGKAAEGSEEECVETAEQTEETITEKVISSASENDNVGNNLENDTKKVDHEEAGNATDGMFECLICDFKSTWEFGLKVHMGKKHSNIEQIDGHVELEEDDDKYEKTEDYWKKGRLGVAYYTFLDAMCLIDSYDISEDDKKEEKEKLLDARKAALGKTFYNFPPWSKKVV